MSQPTNPTIQPLTCPSSWRTSPVIAGISLLICFPVGLSLIWTNSRWSLMAKTAWTTLFAAIVMIGLIGKEQERKEVRGQLADANRLWDAGDRADMASEQYAGKEARGGRMNGGASSGGVVPKTITDVEADPGGRSEIAGKGEKPSDAKPLQQNIEPLKFVEIVYFDTKLQAAAKLTADYFPHRPGVQFISDGEWHLPSGGTSVVRMRGKQLEGGLIQTNQLKVGLLENGRTQWVNEREQKPASLPAHHMVHDGFVKIGTQADASEKIFWLPKLKIGAKQNDEWRVVLGDGSYQFLWSVVAFGRLRGREVVMVSEAFIYPEAGMKSLQRTTTRTVYMKGVGQVLWESETQTFRTSDFRKTASSRLVNLDAFNIPPAPDKQGKEIPSQVKQTPVKSERALYTLESHTSDICAVAFSPDGTILASGGKDKSILLWDVRNRKLTSTLKGHTGYIDSLAFSPDKKTLASASWDKTIRLWSLDSGKTVSSIKTNAKAVVFSPDGKNLASSGMEDGPAVKLWSLESRKIVWLNYAGPRMNLFVACLAFSPDGKTLASGSADCAIKLWDVKSGRIAATLAGHNGLVCTLAFSPDGKTLASGGWDCTIHLWDVAERKMIVTLSTVVSSLAFSPDGKTLASGGGSDNAVQLWDVSSGKNTASLVGHTEGVTSVAFNPDGKTLASGSRDKTVKLWRMTNNNSPQSPHTPESKTQTNPGSLPGNEPPLVDRSKQPIIQAAPVDGAKPAQPSSAPAELKVDDKTSMNEPRKVQPQMPNPGPKLAGDWSGKYISGMLAGSPTSMRLREPSKGKVVGTWTDKNGVSAYQGVRTANRVTCSVTWQHHIVGQITTNASGQISHDGKTLTLNFIAIWRDGGRIETDKGEAVFQRDAEAQPVLKPGVRQDRKLTVTVNGQTSEVPFTVIGKPEPSLPPAPVLKAVTLLALGNDPGKFDGQTLTVRGNLSGTLYEGGIHYRLTVNGNRFIADGERIRKTGINFVVQKDQKESLAGGLSEGRFYPVKMTVTIKQLPKGFWIAVVSKVERE